jgi:hypothetical protein
LRERFRSCYPGAFRKDAGGNDVVSVGPVFTEHIQGETYYTVVAIMPDCDVKDFVVKTPISTTTKPPIRLNGRGHIP